MSEDKNPGGRPTEFTEANFKFIRYMATRGATDKEIADELEVTETTVNNWKNKYPEFFVLIKEWKKEADEKVERKLYERAMGYSCKETKAFLCEGKVVTEDIIKNYPPDTTAAIFWLKNRDQKNWRDKQEIDMSNKGAPIEIVLAYKKKEVAND